MTRYLEISCLYKYFHTNVIFVCGGGGWGEGVADPLPPLISVSGCLFVCLFLCCGQSSDDIY